MIKLFSAFFFAASIVCCRVPAAEFVVFSTAGPCPKCGVLLHDVKPVKVQDSGLQQDASGTTIGQLLTFKCAKCGKFQLAGPPKHLPPPTLIKATVKDSLTPQKIATPLPPMPQATGVLTNDGRPVKWAWRTNTLAAPIVWERK